MNQLVYKPLRYIIALTGRTATIEHKVSVLVVEIRKVNIVEYFP
jgi:hypothetical protein